MNRTISLNSLSAAFFSAALLGTATLSTAVLSTTLFSGAALADDNNTPRLVTAEDYYRMVDLGDVQISADGQSVAFVKTTVGEDKRSRNSIIWVHRNGEPVLQFTREKSDFSPVFTNDGKQLLFLSGRDNGTALYSISLSGGEAQELLRLQQGSISSVSIHPNDQELLLTVRVDPEVENPLEEATESDDKPDISVITNAAYKRQGGYLNEDRTGLWSYNLAEKTLAAITGNSQWHEGSASYSPNGECIAFASNRHPEADEGYFASSVFVRCGSDERELATPIGHAGTPVWTSNNSLVYVYRESSYAAPNLHHYDLSIDAYQVIAEAMNHSPAQLQFADNKLWFTTDDRGSRTLYNVDLDRGGYQYVSGRGWSKGSFAIANNGAMAWVEHNEITLPRLVYTAASNDERVVVTDFNDALQSELDLAAYEVFQTENERGDILDVFMLRPPQVVQGERYPVILNIKGGPGGMWGHQWFHEMQLMRAHGYAVVFVNYRGSSGYGQDFAEQVRLDYGGADFRDNIVALNAAFTRYNWLDEDQQFITGGSHGGFLTNWATTQTNRFRAAVTQRSVSNWISEAGTQAFPPLSMIEEFGGTIWENYDYYWGRSPLKYADRVSTPTLIIHSNHDHITPIGQGEEWFFALKANNVPVELIVFDREGHGLSRAGRPINLVARLDKIMDWFDRYNN